MNINIKDYVGVEEKQVYTLVKKDPDKRSAFDRLDALNESFAHIESVVNATDIANTSDAWHRAYSMLTQAFYTCIKCERGIIE